MEHPRSDETREKQIVGLYCNIYDEKNTVWRTLFPGMTPEWIIENMIPGYIEGVNFFKFPNLNIDLENIPMVISDYVALGWIDPTLVSDNEADMPYQRYINAVTPL